MVGSVGSAGFPQGLPPMAATLSEDQKTTVASILENYDPSAVSEEDAKSILQALREAGVPPGKGLEQALGDAGFDFKSMRTAAFGDRPPPGGFQGGEGQTASVSSQALEALRSILDQYDLSNLTDDDKQGLAAALTEAGLLMPGSVIDRRV